MSEARSRILVVDDDASVREALASALDEAGYAVIEVEGVERARAAVGSLSPDAVLLDIRLRDGDGLALLAELRRDFPKLPVIMATAYGDSDRTIRAMSAGAFDYVTKPFDFDGLLATISRAVRTTPAVRTPSNPSSATLIGSSPAMLEVWKLIGRAAASDLPVLITGESGVGKELVAQAIHQHGARAAEPFVAVNLSALPATLIESELFGHERGAFTGAVGRREGRFETAGAGTLFLDEIGDLDVPLQTKLLRVLEDGRFERLGGAGVLQTRARIVSATSKPVKPREPGTSLREDLYYRLGVIRIDVPALRRRRQDIPLLVDSFLRASSQGRRALSDAAVRRLEAYAWPGNVRELRHAIENACAMSRAEVLDADDFSLGEDGPQRATPTPPYAPEPLEDLDLARSVAATERRVIGRALELAKGNRAQAARLLGIRRALLYTRMKELGLGSAGEREDD